MQFVAEFTQVRQLFEHTKKFGLTYFTLADRKCGIKETIKTRAC
jgi:hypothetical protein